METLAKKKNNLYYLPTTNKQNIIKDDNKNKQ